MANDTAARAIAASAAVAAAASETDNRRAAPTTFIVNERFGDAADAAATPIVTSGWFRRSPRCLGDASELLLDNFPDFPAAGCCFARFAGSGERAVRIRVLDVDRVVQCVGDGWVLSSTAAGSAFYRMPQMPMVRTLDAHGRILSEAAAAVIDFSAAGGEVWAEFVAPAGSYLDIVVWHFAPAHGIEPTLHAPLTIETQPWFAQLARGTTLPGRPVPMSRARPRV